MKKEIERGAFTESDVEDEEREGVLDIGRTGSAEVRHLADGRGERKLGLGFRAGGGRRSKGNRACCGLAQIRPQRLTRQLGLFEYCGSGF